MGASSKTNFLVFIWFHLGWPSLWVSFRARNSLCPHLLSCGQNCLLLRCFCCFCAASALLLCAYDFLKAAAAAAPCWLPSSQFDAVYLCAPLSGARGGLSAPHGGPRHGRLLPCYSVSLCRTGWLWQRTWLGGGLVDKGIGIAVGWGTERGRELTEGHEHRCS